MNSFKRGVLVLGLLGVAGAAQAQFSSSITATSDYDFRGVSLSAKDPALQASLDYAFSNGFAVGAWASNIDSGPGVDGDLEVDLYAGYSAEINDTTGWNAGIVWYTYPGSDDIDSYPEAYVGVTFGSFSLTQWYSNDYVAADESAWYTAADYDVALPNNFSLSVHAGYNYGDFFDSFDGEYLDYAVALGYTAGNFDLGLKLVGIDGVDEIKDDVFNSETRLIFSLSTTFPWGE